MTQTQNSFEHLSWTMFRNAMEFGDIARVKRFLLVHDQLTYCSYVHRFKCQQCGLLRFSMELAAHFGNSEVFEVLLHDSSFQTAAELFELVHETEYKWHLSRVLEISCRHAHFEIVQMLVTHGQQTWIPQVRSVLKKILLAALLSHDVRIIQKIHQIMLELGFSRHMSIVQLAYREGISIDLLFQLGMNLEDITKQMDEFECPPPHQLLFQRSTLSKLPWRWWRFVDKFERTVIDQACVQGDVQVLRDLLSILDKTEYCYKAEPSVLSLSARYGRVNIVKFLLDSKRIDSTDRMDVLKGCARIALQCNQIRVADVPIQLLLHECRPVYEGRKSTFLAKIARRKRKESNPPIKYGTLEKLMLSGNSDLMDLVLCSMRTTSTGYYFRGDCICSEEYLRFFLHTPPDPLVVLPATEQLFRIGNWAWYRMDLVTFELLLDRLKELRPDVPESEVLHTFCDRMVHNAAHWSTIKAERVVNLLQLLHIMLTSCYGRCSLVDRAMQVQLRKFHDCSYFDILLDGAEIPNVFRGDDRIRYLDAERDRRQHYVKVLQSMCGWTDPHSVSFRNFFMFQLDLSEEDKVTFLNQVVETGVRVFDTEMLHSSVDYEYFGPLNRSNEWSARHQATIGYRSGLCTLKALCRISLRRHLRMNRKYCSMTEMISTFYYDGFIPRSMIDYLLFRDK